MAYPDTLFGTDSHTTMVNGLGVVGWGVGGIEAEAAMLGQPSSMLIPQVVGFRLTGRAARRHDGDRPRADDHRGAAQEGRGRQVRRVLRARACAHLTIADRVTLGNMCPEYGATVAIFPIDDMTLDYLRFTGRDAVAGGSWSRPTRRRRACSARDATPDAVYTDTLTLDLATVEPSLAGPRRPQDRVPLSNGEDVVRQRRCRELQKGIKKPARRRGRTARRSRAVAAELDHGAVVIAAITSCTNTSNPSVMIGAGLVAKKAVERGLTRKPWVKTSLAPGSKVVTEYLEQGRPARRTSTQLGFNLVGYGCTTCIGNSGPLPDEISARCVSAALVVCSVLSGNRNFEGRIQQDVRANYLASPPLVVAYALAGSLNIDLTTEPLGTDQAGSRSTSRTSGRREQEIQETMLAARDGGHVPRAVRERLRRRRALAGAAGADGRSVRVGGGLDLHPRAAVPREPDEGAGAAGRRSPARACSRCSATASRPTTSHRPARSRRTARPGST